MSNAKHTPGPWEIAKYYKATELLEALKAARLQFIDDHAIAIPEEQEEHALLVQMDAAIAKAEGVQE